MSKGRPQDLLKQIERDLIAEKPLDTLLRKLILLGGNAGSPELRQWAATELRGYEDDNSLPSYRRVNAPLQIDGAVPGGVIRHQSISSMDLPDFARAEIGELVPLRMGVNELHSMVRNHSIDHIVKLQPPGAALLVGYMNRDRQLNGRIDSLYWSVSTVAIEGVLDQVRTRLAELIAELRSTTSSDQALPTPMQAANAVNLVLNGRGHRVSIAQAAGNGVVTPVLGDDEPRFWTTARVIGAAVVGLATLTGTGIAIIQWLS
ncbi:hypothetical protein [Microbacterium sp. MYb62]|uniref:AbiTii domain-containing protein n=1 Tax=Microbacterium sp. MYb62 TaxID=1848690 RepID=UPI000CFBA317|nr:hypothetical protein [Microbacterium sp. MYb62]PRB18851.1 hypothetical protein CQ042_00065 [Microbacterium sp. MYb62]